MITSHHNERLKVVRRLQRRRDRDAAGLFVAEGEDLIAAARAAGREPEELFCVAGSGLEGEEVDPDVLQRVSSLGSGTRTLGVFRQEWAEPTGPLCVALWGVGDPGNVGTVLRSALAFGAASVVLGPGTADPHGPKAVRASMGAVFAVAVARTDEVAALPRPAIALDARAGEPLDGPRQGTLVIGAEREGLAPEVIAACDETAHIAIRSESLNAAMAATVALYEAAHRMRRP